MKIGFIGAGKMGEAIISRLIKSAGLDAADISVCDINHDRVSELKQHHGISVRANNAAVADSAGIIFLAVKPQDMDSVLDEISGHMNKRHVVISIAAGKRLSSIQALLPGAGVIVRVMPNIATLVAEGMSAFCAGSAMSDSQRQMVVGLLSSFGKVIELPEEQFDAVTALSGSGPAFFAHFLNAMIKGGQDLGLTPDAAALLARQTMLGTARLITEEIFSAERLIEAVASAKGTTEAGMNVLAEAPINNIVAKTLRAAAERSKALSA